MKVVLACRSSHCALLVYNSCQLFSDSILVASKMDIRIWEKVDLGQIRKKRPWQIYERKIYKIINVLLIELPTCMQFNVYWSPTMSPTLNTEPCARLLFLCAGWLQGAVFLIFDLFSSLLPFIQYVSDGWVLLHIFPVLMVENGEIWVS